MISEDQKDTQTESTVVSVLDNLKTSNLPEIIGWKEKQEKLVKDNPYLEIVDTKTYNEACKRRTALLKGRTELKSQETKIASKLSTFRKEVGTETASLIAITQPHEEKQDAEVKRWESVKAKEKEEKANAEANRVKAIQDKLESVETEAYKIIQPMLFSEIEAKSKEVEALLKADGFDFEEYDVVLDQVVSRVESALSLKINNLTEQENQRVENERLKKEQEVLKAKEELQNKRLQEILPYIAFGEPIDATKLYELSGEEWDSVFDTKRDLFNAKAKEDAKLEEERLAKEKEEKAVIFETKKTRLFEIGFTLTEENVFSHPDLFTGISSESIFEAGVLDFENIISAAKNGIQEVANKKEVKAKREQLFLEAGIPLGENFEFLKIGDFTITKFSVFDSIEEDFQELLSDAKKAFFKFRSSSIEQFGYKLNEETSMFEMDGFLPYPSEMVLLPTTDFDYWLGTVKEQVDDVNKKLAEADAAKLKAANKERIKKFAKDKKSLTEFLESLDFRIAVPEMENKEMEEILNMMVTQVNTFISESVQIVNNY